MLVDRQKELQEEMKRRDAKEKELHDKIIAKLYVEPKGTPKPQ